MSVACNHCGAAVQLSSTSVISDALPSTGDPLMPFVKAQMKDLKTQNANLVTENESLSAKLVESTEARMDLDAQLNATQMELQAAQSQIKTLKNSQTHYEQLLTMISNGQLIEKKDVQPVIENLAYESQRRSQIEFSKQKLESELEDLSRTLFEEANRMVIEERQINFLASKRIEALERQLDEVLDLCKSEREQLVELKVRLEKLSEEKDTLQRERDTLDYAYHQLHHQYQLVAAASSSGPLSLHQHITTAAALRHGVASHLSSHSTTTGSVSPVSSNSDRAPSGPGSLALQLESAAGSRRAVQQAMQLDLRHHQSSAASVRSKTDSCYFSDGDHPGSHFLNEANEDRIPTLGFHLWDPAFMDFKHFLESIFSSGSNAQKSNVSSQTNSAATGSGISSLYAFSILGKQPAQTNNNNAVIPINTLLSQSRLLKIMASEDVEATLRFEPGNLLSWTQRKRLMAAVTDNTLVVEAVPVVANATLSPVAQAPVSGTTPAVKAAANGNNAATPTAPTTARPNCALCGNNIHTPLYYQYRLTDTSNESRTICPYCRTRLTSVCTFYSVLRMLSKRIISSSTTPEKLYLDFLRIRLSMFLARCGVGVVTGDEPKQQQSSPPPQQQQQQQQQQQHPHHHLSSSNAGSQHPPLPLLVKRESARSAGETMGGGRNTTTGPSLLRESVSMYSEPAETPTTTVARKVVVVTPALEKDIVKTTEPSRPSPPPLPSSATMKDPTITTQ